MLKDDNMTYTLIASLEH